jgi:hypothetical protein
MKQGFYRSEAFELGEPGELNVGERRHRRTSLVRLILQGVPEHREACGVR